MTKLTQEQLNEILDLHALWVKDNTKGKQADLSEHDLSELDFYNRDLTKVNFQNANCRGANFLNSICKGANFQNANCLEANFKHANCQAANFTESNCQYANCQYTNFQNANCREADYNKANCRRSDFEGANLKGADLQDTNVSEIKGKVIAAVQGLQGEKGRQITLLAEGEEKDWIIFCGCFIGTREDLDYWLKAYGREGYRYDSTLKTVGFLFDLCRNYEPQ